MRIVNDFSEMFFNSIQARMLSRNKNWLCVICGETGGGKSYSALSIADSISPEGINVETHVIFSPEEFLEKLVNSKGIQRGDVLVFDEAGVGMSARAWYSLQNRLLGMILQTFRHRNIGVIFTCPDLSFVDIQARKLFHNYAEAKYVDFEKEVCYLKLYNIENNSRYGKVYFKYPRFKGFDGNYYKIEYLGVQKPRLELIEAYETRKIAFTNKLNKDSLDRLTRKSEPTRGSSKRIGLSHSEIANQLVGRKEYYFENNNGRERPNYVNIAADFGLKPRTIRTILKEYREEGHG